MPDGTHRPAAPGALISVVATGDPGVGDGDGCGLDEQANAIAGIASRAVRMPTILPPNGWGRESGETRTRYNIWKRFDHRDLEPLKWAILRRRRVLAMQLRP